MRNIILITFLTLTAACATWEGVKTDVKTGADAVSDAVK
jgi:predicted small secreted protein